MILGCKQSKHREVVGLSFISLFIFSVINSIPVFADYAISMTTSGSQTIDVFPETTDGIGTSIGHDDITVTTTCRSGYNLTVGTSVSDNNLYLNGSNTNNVSGTYFAPADGLSALHDSTNTWGFYYNPSTAPTRSSVFSAVPALGNPNATIVSERTTPSQTDISDSLSVYYGVSVSNAINPGTYKMISDSGNNEGVTTYYLTLAEACIPYIVSFSPTSTSTGSSISGTGTMASQEYYKNTPANLPTMSFTPPSGYEFKEWNTAEDGTGTSYADEEEVTNLTTPGNSITLYAIWWQPPKTLANSEYMQEVNYCPPSLTAGQVYTLKDSRDETEYSVAKLADGNCWMLDNLMLNPVNSTVAANMDSSNTNADDTSLDCLLGRVTDCASPYTASAVSFGSPRGAGATAKILNYTNTTATSYGSNNGNPGMFYNYCAAFAGSTCGNVTDKEGTLYDIDGDICPSGWHIPTGTSSGEYQTLYNSYPGNASGFNNAFSLILSGYFNGDYQDNPQQKNSSGSFITSTYGIKIVYFSTSAIGHRSLDRFYESMPIRCIFNATAEPDIPTEPINLYDAVADLSQGTQTAANLQTTIDTTNSGVFEYNSSVFGTDTDGTKSDNTKATIYYYRGILDYTTGTYGSDGDGEAWPNYVVLADSADELTSSDTCWRIIRTTGSGGVKMIYNGTWTGTTCANATNNARIGTSAYNTNSTGSNPVRRIALAGYTYNSYGASTSTTAISTNTLFGSDSDYTSNTNSSIIKGNIDSWYNNNLSGYTSILESNAGYCNDRTTYSNTSGTTIVTQLRPAGNRTSNGTTAYFGAYPRNGYNSPTIVPSLTCSRNNADVYTTSIASAGNKQLTYPIALITADELSFAGAGSQTANQGSTYNPNTFVRSGNNFWTMSPSSRTTSNSYATLTYYSSSNGYLSSGQITTTSYDIRPVVSLIEGTEAVSGTGTATDPWVVEAP